VIGTIIGNISHARRNHKTAYGERGGKGHRAEMQHWH
jgi:hypothetical protein